MKNGIILPVAVIAILFAPLSAIGAEKLDRLYGVSTDDRAKTVTIIVAASGCTEKSDFSFSLEGDVLIFKRIMPDACKAMPQRYAITYSLKELGIDPESNFRIGNPISLRDHVMF